MIRTELLAEKYFLLTCVCLAEFRSQPFHWHTRRQNQTLWSEDLEILSVINWSTKGNRMSSWLFVISIFSFFRFELLFDRARSVFIYCLETKTRLHYNSCVFYVFLHTANFCFPIIPFHQRTRALISFSIF